MRILAVDTSTPSGSVALLVDQALRGEINLDSRLTHSSRLLRSIDDLLRAAGLDIREVDAFAATIGPGSFTGIRIGLSAVKALSFASGKPVAPVSTLSALAYKAGSREIRLTCPILDAKKGEIYAALFEFRGHGLSEIIPQGAYVPARLFSLFPARRHIHFLGSGLPLYAEDLGNLLGEKAHFLRRSPFIAAEVGLLGSLAILEGRGVPAGSLDALYFRRSQAEENRPT